MIGQLKITTTDKETGEVLHDTGFSNNAILDTGIRELIQRLVTEDIDNSFGFYTIYLGDDYGDPDEGWTVFDPEPADRSFTEQKQNWIYFLPTESLSITYPAPGIFEVSSVMDGDEVMETNFPTEIEMTYTSATLRMNNVTALAFKRFPIRSLSRSVRITITWVITLTNGKEYCENIT